MQPECSDGYNHLEGSSPAPASLPYNRLAHRSPKLPQASLSPVSKLPSALVDTTGDGKRGESTDTASTTNFYGDPAEQGMRASAMDCSKGVEGIYGDPMGDASTVVAGES